MGSSTGHRLRQAIAEAAPTLARALGGPLAGSAVALISQAVLGRREEDPGALSEALATASPEAWAALREADLAFQQSVLEATTEEQRIAHQDRASARAREMALRDHVPGFLAFAVVAGFFGVLATMLIADIPTGAETEFSIMLGALATMAASVMNYYFGSSAGSRAKTQLLGARERSIHR